MNVSHTNTNDRTRELEQHLFRFRTNLCTETEITGNPLDELETLNHFCFRGGRDMTQNFRVLTVNDFSFGDETLFLAAQLAGTNALIVHYDASPAAVETVRRRAETLGLAARIRFTSGSLTDLLESLGAKQKILSVKNGIDADRGTFGPFDYVRCRNALDHANDPQALLELMVRFLNENGVLGISCYGYYGREAHRQMQAIGKALNGDRPGIREELARMKELYLFLPNSAWPRLAFENLSPELRAAGDEAWLSEFLREDEFSMTVPQIHEFLDRHGFTLAQFSREMRASYKPWFALGNPEYTEPFLRLSERQMQAFSEIAWNNIERHHFWAVRGGASVADATDPDNIPFYNHFASLQHSWKRLLPRHPETKNLTLSMKVGNGDRFETKIPWGREQRRFVELIDGYKTLGEIAILVREEAAGTVGLEELIRLFGSIIRATEMDDIFLLRQKDTPPLPFTVRHLRGAA